MLPFSQWILLTASFLLLLLGFTLASFFRSVLTRRRLLKHGIEAPALLLHVETTGVFFNRQEQLSVRLQVQPLKDRNFVASARIFRKAPGRQLQVGSAVRVKYSLAHKKEVVLLD